MSKNMKMIGIFMIVAGSGLVGYWVLTQAFPDIFPPIPGTDGGDGGSPTYRVTCNAHLTWSVIGGTDLNGVTCSTDRKCGIFEGSKLIQDNGDSGYIEYSRSGGGIQQPVSLGLLGPEKTYRTEFCSKETSGSVTYIDERGFPDQTLTWSVSIS